MRCGPPQEGPVRVRSEWLVLAGVAVRTHPLVRKLDPVSQRPRSITERRAGNRKSVTRVRSCVRARAGGPGWTRKEAQGAMDPLRGERCLLRPVACFFGVRKALFGGVLR